MPSLIGAFTNLFTISSSSLKTIGTKMTATVANKCLHLRVLRTLFNFILTIANKEDRAKIPYPAIPIVQKGLQTKHSPWMWYNIHFGQTDLWGQLQSFFTPSGTEIMCLISRCWPRSQWGCCGISSQAVIPKHTQLQGFQTRIGGPTLSRGGKWEEVLRNKKAQSI